MEMSLPFGILCTETSAGVDIKHPSAEKQEEGETVVAISIEYSQRNLALEKSRSTKGVGRVVGGIVPTWHLTESL